MKIGVSDCVTLKDEVEIGTYKKHGVVLRINPGSFYPIEILFADGVVENYACHQCKVISAKEYFLLQLS